MTFAPEPPAAGPTPGQPGHFAHHQWVEDWVSAMDVGKGGLLVLSQTNAQNVPDNQLTTLRLDTVIAQAGEWDAAFGPVFGDVVCGPSWVPGWYRVDYQAGFTGVSSSTMRAATLKVNNQSPASMPALGIQTPSGNTGSRPWSGGGTGLVFLVPGDTIQLQARHMDGGWLETSPGSTQLIITLHWPSESI